MHEKDPVLDFLEQDPETDAEAFIQTKAKAKALAEAAKAAPPPAAPPTKPALSFQEPTSPLGETGERIKNALFAATPYLPGGGAATGIGKVLSMLLPVGAAAHAAFKPPTEGQKAESAVGGAFNIARESGLRIPGVSPLLQSTLAMGAEGLLGSLANQTIETGKISPEETTGSTLLGLGTGFAGGIYPSGFRKNAVQKMEDLAAPGGKLADLNTIGLQKDYTPVTETAQRYAKSAQDLGSYEKSLADYSKAKTKFDTSQLKKKTKWEAEQLAKQKAYDALAPHEKLTQAPPTMEPFVPDKPPTAPKAPGPQANIIRKQYREAGFSDADLPFVERLAKDPDTELDKIFDAVFSSNPEREAPRTAANQTLNKVIKLFDSAKSKNLLKQKLGERLFATQLNPNTVAPTDNPLNAFSSAAKGGDSALEKILSKEEREAIIPAVDAVKSIAKAGKLGNYGIGVSGSSIWARLSPAVILELTPQRMANHVLVNAKNPESLAATKAFASYIRGLKGASPLTGGRLTRAATETIEKGLLGLGARPVVGSEAADKRPQSAWSPFSR